MPSPFFYAVLSVFIISLLSLIGIITLVINKNLLNKYLTYLVGFSAGGLLGDTFFHLLPEGLEKGFTHEVSFYILGGILTLFVVEKIIRWRHCHHINHKGHKHTYTYMNLIGDALHNFIDGLVIGGAYLVNIPIGIATTLAVIFHEIPQEIGDFAVLVHGGFKSKKALYYNFLTALTSVIGVLAAFGLSNYVGSLAKFLVLFASGHFIYIACSDLIPELNKTVEPKKSLLEGISIILGIVLMYGLMFVEIV